MGSKRRALALHFSVRIWYMFSISKCRGKSHVSLCQTSVLAKRRRLRRAVFRRILRPNTCLNRKSALDGCIPFASTEVMRTPRSDFPLHIDVKETYQIRMGRFDASARRLLSATLLERWLQVCHVKITFELLRTTLFVSTRTNLMKCVVNWIPLNSHVRSKQNPTLP